MSNSEKSIVIKGARVHNLKNIDVEIPHNALVVITGLSGSGKSTLAFDTIFAEGQRRYVESLSAYARQFLGRVAKPDVDLIEGIAPAIAIEQRVSSRNPRSTVGTTTEIYDYLKLLFARIGATYSPISGDKVTCQGTPTLIAAPLPGSDEQGVIERLLEAMQSGVMRLYVDGTTTLIEEFMATLTDQTKSEDILIVVDRIKVAHDDEAQSRLRDSISRAYSYGNGSAVIITKDVPRWFSSRFEADGITFDTPTEHTFSFNNPLGACPLCEGYGKTVGIDEDLVVPDKRRTIYEDAIACWRSETMRRWKMQLILNAPRFNFPVHTPYYELTPAERRLLWTGNKYFEGLNTFFAYLDSERRKIQFRIMKARYTGKTICPECGGSRLRKEALYVKIADHSIADLVTISVDKLIDFFDSLTLDIHEQKRAERILLEIRNRLKYLSDVGLGYLTLNRLSSTLSGGESQRINLSTSLGSNLTGSLYILDEPSIGLHPRDTARLIGVLKELRDLGNTVIVVEHEEEIIRAADYIVDVGPEAGYLGGEIVFSGSYDKLLKSGNTLTAKYLNGELKIQTPASHRSPSGRIDIKGARENNLKGIDVTIPLGVMTCITGVSGSGKSSLVKGILYPALRRLLHENGDRPGAFDALEGDTAKLSAVEMIDQNPIGKSSRSNPATYIKAYDEIRKLFSELPYSYHTGLTASAFSFNIAGGRCDECQGEGIIKVGMQFMADVELTCEVCKGMRFKPEVLEAKYKGRTIYDILEMTVDEAMILFSQDDGATAKRIVERIRPLQEVGLGYVKMGQSSSTLSGGESQRVKLASFLGREGSAGEIMFIFDEPTTGLHFHDINRLLKAFYALIERGHTVVIVEHNLEVIKCADYIVDIGPEAGTYGGEVVFQGNPDEIYKIKASHTAQAMRMNLERR